MLRLLLIPTLAVPLLFAGAPQAAADGPPPQGAKPLSEILRMVEARDNFHYIDEVELDDGVYKIEYYTRDKAKVDLRLDPMTGNPR